MHTRSRRAHPCPILSCLVTISLSPLHRIHHISSPQEVSKLNQSTFDEAVKAVSDLIEQYAYDPTTILEPQKVSNRHPV